MQTSVDWMMYSASGLLDGGYYRKLGRRLEARHISEVLGMSHGSLVLNKVDASDDGYTAALNIDVNAS